MSAHDVEEVIVVGNGIAGLSAAVRLAENKIKVHLVAPYEAERAQSVMAMGGINAALNTKNEEDSPHIHYQDTMKSGFYINDAEAVKHLVNQAPGIVQWLKEIGVNFALDKNGDVDLRKFGGQSKIRTAYSSDRTGKQIVSAIVSKVRKYESKGYISSYIGYRFFDLLLKKDECIGAVFLEEDSNDILTICSDAVIIATGGMNGVFKTTTGSVLNDGYTTGKLLSLGVHLSNLEMIQYHPTTINTKTKPMLITEAVRGIGGRLYTIKDRKKWYFMEEWFPKYGALMPRDIVSQSIYKIFHDDSTNKMVYLDISHLDKSIIDEQLEEVINVCDKHLNLNPYKEAIPISPSIHYFMGGIKTDAQHRTNIKRLFAAGECSSQYHGANRLGGNSLLGAVCGGLTSSDASMKLNKFNSDDKEKIAKDATKQLKDSIKEWQSYEKIPWKNFHKMQEQLTFIMKETMAIYRNEKMLLNTLNELKKMEGKIVYYPNFYQMKTLEMNILLARAMVKSALNRRESRGAHQRTDYPETLERYSKVSIAKYEDGICKIEF